MSSHYGTSSLFSPMFFEFPDDVNAYSDTHINIMLGPALKLSVNTYDPKLSTTQFYFP